MNRFIALLYLMLTGCVSAPEKGRAVFEPAAVKPPVSINREELEDIIAVFSKAIKENPGYSGAYFNRATAYFYNGQYDKSWDDIHKAEELGMKNDPMCVEFVARLKQASGREK